MKNLKLRTLCLALIAALIACTASVALAASDTVIVATEDYTEEYIFGYIFKDLIEEYTDYKVDLKEGLGGTAICFNALKAGEIDVYLEYTGTAYGAILALPNDDSVDMFSVVKQRLSDEYQLKSLDIIGFNNTYCLAMKRDKAEKYGVSAISDLIGLEDKLRFAPSFEFVEREDGMKKLQSDYEGLEFSEVVPLEGTLKYISAESDEIDIVLAFSTDGMLQKYDMVILEDDRHSMFPYEAFPLVRQDSLERFPGLEEALNKLANAISDQDMSYMNYLVDVEQRKPEDVAHDYLAEHGYIQ